MATPKQEKLIKLLTENYGTKGKTKTLYKLLLEAGYSEESARNPKYILEGEQIKEGMEPFLKSMTDKRKMSLTHLTENKLEKAPAREVAYVVDILTKNIQLLNGGETERAGLKISFDPAFKDATS